MVSDFQKMQMKHFFWKNGWNINVWMLPPCTCVTTCIWRMLYNINVQLFILWIYDELQTNVQMYLQSYTYVCANIMADTMILHLNLSTYKHVSAINCFPFIMKFSICYIILVYYFFHTASLYFVILAVYEKALIPSKLLSSWRMINIFPFKYVE